MKINLLFPTIVAGFGGILLGFEIEISRIAIPLLAPEMQLDALMVERFFMVSFGGCFLGALFFGRQADFFGRRKLMTILAFLFLICSVGSGVVNNFYLLMVFRFITGAAVGGISVISPIYLSEISPPKLRGRLVSSFPLGIALGILWAVFSDQYAMTMSANNWRYIFISGGFPAVIFFLLLFFIPESPRWLLQKGHERVVRFLIYKLNPGVDKDKMVEEIKESINIEIMAAHIYLFQKPYLKLVLTGIFIGIFAQLSGITAIMLYAPGLLKSAGISSASHNTPLLIIGIISVISTVATFFLIDSTGRKKLLLIGSAGMSVCLFFLSFLYFTGLQLHFIMALLVLIFTGLFTISLGVVIPVFLSELFPYNIRARGVSLGMSFYWLCTFLVWHFIPKMETETGAGLILLLFALMTFVSFFIYRKFFPEMKGKSLEELERELMNDRT